MRRSLALVLGLVAVAASQPSSPFSYYHDRPPSPPHHVDSAAGKPLFLTPYIEAGKLEEGRKLSRVSGLSTDVESYSGFLTVNKTMGSNLFFWFFPAASGADRAPTVLWLQGGPGGSSLFGLFVENGPFRVDAKLRLLPRSYSWHNTHNLLYIDQPVSTGFSFTGSEAGLATSEDDVARDLYSGLVQFFTLFKQVQNNPFFVTGESYGGKYIPAIAYKIHQENPTAKLRIPLQGVAIGDGLSDPIYQIDYGNFLYNVGLIGAGDRDLFLKQQNATKELVRQGRFLEAMQNFGVFMGEYEGITGLGFVYNYLLQDQPAEFNYFPSLLERPDVRAALHVGSLEYDVESMPAYRALAGDFMRTVRDKIVTLLDAGYDVMFYNGQMDVIIDYVGTEALVAALPWSGQQAYLQAERVPWRVQGEVAGYVRRSNNLWQVMVRNAGHILPFDQPQWAYDLISRFTSGKKLFP